MTDDELAEKLREYCYEKLDFALSLEECRKIIKWFRNIDL